MRYKEVIYPPLWLLGFVYFLFLSLVISIWAALGNGPAVFTFLVLTLWLIYLYFKTALKIQVDENFLYVGPAKIEHSYLGELSLLTPAELKLLRTRDADPMAYLAIRFWSSNGIKIEVKDVRDKTPYWLITTNRPQQLLQALRD